MLTVTPTHDLEAVRAFLERDAAYAAYALGDLEPPYAEHARWYLAAIGDSHPQGIALVYDGLEPPALFLMGSDAGLRALLAAQVAPDSVMLLAPDRSEELLCEFYSMDCVQRMVRMRVTPGGFAPAAGAPCPTRPLTPADAAAVVTLIEQTAALDSRDMADIAFSPEMLADGVYYGAESDDQLVAIAGTHLIAPGAGLAALGNVMTHPEWRGRQLATHLSSAVVAALFERGIGTVVLNVRHDNATAMHVYRKLGFEAVSTFLEANGLRIAPVG